MTHESEQGKQAIDRLVALGHMRVWSVIITIFGDAVVRRGGIVASTTLAALTEQMDVRPEAFRVALSRLTKDGWIERSKRGRLSFYQLSARGVAEFGPATARIYANQPRSATGLQLVVLPLAIGEDLPNGAVNLGGRAYLSQNLDHPDDGFRVSGTFGRIPDWVKDRIAPGELVESYAQLSAVLSAISVKGASPLQASVIRVLVVHHWRRLLLRHADLPPTFFPANWQGEACRTLVHRLLSELAPISDPWFDKEIL
jgi:phenylacetic acid degradation operon negative regulatory protein